MRKRTPSVHMPVEDLQTLADLPDGEWLCFTYDDGNPLEGFEADFLAFARANGLVETRTERATFGRFTIG